jgi:hypothetical protein
MKEELRVFPDARRSKSLKKMSANNSPGRATFKAVHTNTLT